MGRCTVGGIGVDRVVSERRRRLKSLRCKLDMIAGLPGQDAGSCPHFRGRGSYSSNAVLYP